MGHAKIEQVIRDHMVCMEQSFSLRADEVADFAARVVKTLNHGNRLLVAGSGLLSGIADHIANIFLFRLGFDRPPLPAIALGGNAGLEQGLARDGQHRQYFQRQLRSIAATGDIFLALSDGHRDEALVEVLATARQAGCQTALLLPARTEFGDEPPDVLIPVETTSPARLYEGALFFGQLLCELVEADLFGI